MVRYLVLGLLRGGARLHGYALVRADRDLRGFELNSGNVYRELQRLSAEGLVRPVANPDGADPRRTPYEITEAGVEAFDEWFEQLTLRLDAHDDDALSLWIVFISSVDPAVGRPLLGRWRDELWLHSKMLERERDAVLLQRREERPLPFPVRANLLARRLKHVGADLEFLDEFRRTYDTWLSRTQASSESMEHSPLGTVKPRQRTGRSIRRR